MKPRSVSTALFLRFFVVQLLLLGFAPAPSALGQPRPYIGFVYPAGGQQGTTFQLKLGGQNLEDVNRVFVTGSNVTAQVLEYNRALGPQEITLLNEQLKGLKRAQTNAGATMMGSETMMMVAETMMGLGTNLPKTIGGTNQPLIAKIEKRLADYCNRPASASLAGIVYAEVTIAPDAQPGQRELRLGTPKGVSNPLVFHVGQLPEVARKPMITAPLQVLGKEEQALRKRPTNEVEVTLTLPATANGQIASGELNRYRFSARKGQRLVITTQARQLIPFIADAVPGWFQPVLALEDANGKEVAYDDDYRFKPDPTMFYEVPKDGEYTFAIYDAIYRGREDFVYRVSIGEIPFITSLFPLGARTGAPPDLKIKGWNVAKSVCTPPKTAEPGIYRLTAVTGNGQVSNPLPFAVDTLPETSESEPDDTLSNARVVTLPTIVNGRIDRPGDCDVFRFNGKSNQVVVAEVYARRLDSPLDSVLKLTDAKGKLLAFNDDREDLGAGVNTHHADSYLRVALPADGIYYVHINDAAQNGGDEYAYRLRISAPRPDFALRVVPSSITIRSNSTAQLSVYVIRKDGFTGPIKLALKDPPNGFSATPVSLTGTQAVARLTLKTVLQTTPEPVNITVTGTAKIREQDVAHEAVPAEDRMQAFLWRHLVPAADLKVLVFDPSLQPPKRTPPARPVVVAEAKSDLSASVPLTNSAPTNGATNSVSTNSVANKPKFTKQQVAGRLRQLKLLYEEGLLTDDFYGQKVAECEAAL